MNHQELYKLLATVQKNVRCPQCGKQYDFSLVQIRGIVDQIVFLELNCPNHMPLLATVAIGKQKPEIRTDEKNQISQNDVIETYHFLKDFKGGFTKIFNDQKRNTNINKGK